MIGLWLAPFIWCLEAPQLSPFDGPRTGDWGYPTSRAFGASEADGRRHVGVDVAAPCGTSVVAMGAGEVVFASAADDPAPSGRRVVVRHRVAFDSLYVEYAHLASVAVGAGRVAAGARLGSVGVAAPGEACHLHLAVRRARPPDGEHTRDAPEDVGYVDPTASTVASGASAALLEGTTLVDGARFVPLETRLVDVGGVAHLAFRRGPDEVLWIAVPGGGSAACVALPAEGWAWTFAGPRPLVLVLGDDAALFARARPDCWVELPLVSKRPRGRVIRARGKTIDTVELALAPLGPELTGLVVRHGGNADALSLQGAPDAPDVAFSEEEQIPEWEPTRDVVGVDGVASGRRALTATLVGRDPLVLRVTSDEEGWDDPSAQGGAVHATRSVTWLLERVEGAWSQKSLSVTSERSSSGDGARLSDSNARSEHVIAGRDAALHGGAQRAESSDSGQLGGGTKSGVVMGWVLDGGREPIDLTVSMPSAPEPTKRLTSVGARSSTALGGCALVLEPSLLVVRCGAHEARVDLLDEGEASAKLSAEVAVWLDPGALWIDVVSSARWTTENVGDDGGKWTSISERSVQAVVLVSSTTADVVTISQGHSSSDY